MTLSKINHCTSSQLSVDAQYNSLREEILVRIKLRHQLIFSSLTLASAFFGLWSKQFHIVAFLYPIFSTFVALSWIQNDNRIGELGRYIRKYIENDLKPNEKNEHLKLIGGQDFIYRRGWETYINLNRSRSLCSSWRIIPVSNIGFILFTQIVSIILALSHLDSIVYKLLFFFDIISLFIVFIIFFKSLKRKSLNLLTFIISIVLSLIIVEIVLQITDKPLPVVSGWLNPKSKLETNQLGFRGQKYDYSDNDYIIVLLGDSQVAAEACSFYWMPEIRLEHHLNNKKHTKKVIKAFSIGAGGYGQDQQLLMLEKYYKTYRADMVILWQTPCNDIWNNIFPTHWPKNGWPKPTFKIVNNELQGPDENFGQELTWSKFKLFSFVNKFFPMIDRDGAWEKYLPHPYRPLTDYKGKISHDWQERWDHNTGLMRYENLETEKSHLSILLTPVSPRMKYGLELTRSLLKKINSLVTKNNGKLILFYTQSVNENCAQDEVVHLLNGNYYRTSRKQMCDNIDYINAGFVSLTVPITISQWRVGPEDGHLNEHATDQVMKDLSIPILKIIE
jgi:hypothetical protein